MKPRLNSFRSDPSGWIGAGVMAAFTVIALWRWSNSGLLFFALAALRDVAAVWFLLTRKPDLAARKFGLADVLAYLSSAMPLMYFGPAGEVTFLAETVASCLSIAGFSLATVALFDLGTSFGVSPANRGVVETGIYRWMSHPIYIGYVTAELAFVILNGMNGAVLGISAALYAKRAVMESRILRGGEAVRT